MFDLILARGWQAIHSLLHSPTRFQRTPATNMSFYDLYSSLVRYSDDCAGEGFTPPSSACRAIARAIDDYVRDLIRRRRRRSWCPRSNPQIRRPQGIRRRGEFGRRRSRRTRWRADRGISPFPVRLRRPIRRSRRVHRLLHRASHEKRRLLLRVDAESALMGWTPIQSILY